MSLFNRWVAAAVILVASQCHAQAAQTVIVTVRVFDGPTGNPADAKKVHLFCRMSDQTVCPIMRRLETKEERKRGVARFEVPDDAATIYQYGTGAEECNFDPTVPPGPAGYASFDAVSLQKIKASGILFQDKCKTTKTNARPM